MTVHGGPGDLGGMGYVSETLSYTGGVIEALQTKDNVWALVDELIAVIEAHCELPIVLIGHSWGAWLAFLAATEKPDLVSHLVLVGSAPFEAHYAKNIEKTRMARLDTNDLTKLERLMQNFRSRDSEDNGDVLYEIGKMMSQADTLYFNGLHDESYKIRGKGDLFSKVWREASELRRTGTLLERATLLSCSVTVIHGDYDPHPYDGVVVPLSGKIAHLDKVLLPHCGHSPWKESRAHDAFFKVLSELLCE